MEYSVRAGEAELASAIDTAYERAENNFARALEIGESSTWLWGPDASMTTYVNQDLVAHQLTGEISVFGNEYRGSDYHQCANPITKELVPDFSTFVLDGTRHYLDQAQEPNMAREQRMVVLDHAKQYALTLFHAAQYPSREQLVSDEDLATTNRFGIAAIHLTRAFYRGILGHDEVAIQHELEKASEVLQSDEIAEYASGINPKYFKTQEMDQPLTNLAASLLAVEDYPDTDIIYALPAGGTQHAIVTQLLYELKYPEGQAPELSGLPISTHSAKTETLNGHISPTVEKIIKQTNPSGKHVLICEDNSNTGTTLSIATDMVNASFPASCNVSMVEFDPRRLQVKNRHPNPETIIANYDHPDFTTAVGIVPVTVGRYPDLQLRKIAPIRRAHQQEVLQFDLEAHAVTDYDELPQSFLTEFTNAYKDILRQCGDLYGYRNPYLVAAGIVRHFSENTQIGERSTDEKYRMIQDMAYTAINYPFLPQNIRSQLEDGQETLDFYTDGPWIREGATDFITELISYAQEADTHLTIWTKGDSAYYSSPPYVGMEEQKVRYTLSGLKSNIDARGFSNSGVGEFVAHPKKTALLGTSTLPNLRRTSPNVTDLVIVDDSEKNLAEAAQQARRFGYTPHPINPLEYDSNRARLPLLTNFAANRQWGPNAAFIIDMDDTLLHEGFRKYHQPRNMALYLYNVLNNIAH